MLENLHPPCSHKKRTFDGQKIPSWLREHRGVEKSRTRAEVGVDK